MSISPKDTWQSSGYESVLGNEGSHPLTQNWMHVFHMANDYRNHWAFGRITSSRIFFSIRFIRFDLTVSNKSYSEDKVNGESFMGQAWKRCQAAPHQVAAGHGQKQNRKHTGNLLEKLLMLTILIPPRLLSRHGDEEKGGLELHFGFRFLALPTILFLIWPLKALP